MKFKHYHFKIILFLIVNSLVANAGEITVQNDPASRIITFGNSRMKMTLCYNKKCTVTSFSLNGQSLISGDDGIFSEITTSSGTFSTTELTQEPSVKIGSNSFVISNIIYGSDSEKVIEKWRFLISENDISLGIERTLPKSLNIHEASFPSFRFDNINTWNGAFLGYGGLAWFYLFNKKLCTYGVHTNSSTFWNSETGNALKVAVKAEGKNVAMKYSRASDDHLIYNISVSDNGLVPRYEKEKRSRFIRGRTDVWDSFTAPAGKYEETVTLSYIDFNDEYGRGTLKGIDGKKVANLLNTIARIGVIDENLFGGNSWHTPYGPICLHEQYIAQMAIGINDETYIDGYKSCLDFYRDHAIEPDGRVMARWAYLDEDAMPGKVNEYGFYEAQWGYLMDSNTDFVANVAQVFDLTGDIGWVSRHKATCEKALEYLLNRDSNGNNLVEMMTDSRLERRGSDWIDIIWASYENAFVNAKLYYALSLWSNVERLLNDNDKAEFYGDFAARLKDSFNKPIGEGGFWNDHNKWYVHWREKDNSVHGDNLVVPVNFMAIVYGICSDTTRRNAILDKIEELTAHENLFFWPICIFPYTWDEGNDWQSPFPNYENGDLFLSWGSLGVEAYSSYKPDIALKYINNVLDRYGNDGLAYQRYGRIEQNGLGDDILSGNSLTLVGLYKAVYGINPLYNRLYLNPHITEGLSGTELLYNFRKEKLKIELETGRYSVSAGKFRIISGNDFGYYSDGNEIFFFNHNADQYSLKAATRHDISLEITGWNKDGISWTQSSTQLKGKVDYSIRVWEEGKTYNVSDGKKSAEVKRDKAGFLNFNLECGNKQIIVKEVSEKSEQRR